MSCKPTRATMYTAVLASLLLAFSGRAFAGGIEFSAVMEAASDGTVTKTKVYFAKDRQRLEMSDAGTGEKVVMIVRPDKGVAWSLMPSEMLYMEIHIDPRDVNPLMRQKDVVKTERIGPEDIDGRHTMKEKVTTREADGTTSAAYYWQSRDLGWPVQAAALDGSWRYTYRDIKQGRQDPSLFEIPAGYKKMDMPGSGMPGGEVAPPDEPESPDDLDTPDMPEPPEVPDKDPGMPLPYF